MLNMKRRAFITLIGGAAAWPARHNRRVGALRIIWPTLIDFYDMKIAGAMPILGRASCY
jgi:hypothetical protein